MPALDGLTDVEIAEAVRAGPYVMPKFSPQAISNAQLDSIIRYLDYAEHPQDPGGWSIGRIGPVPEGLVAWLIAGAAARRVLPGRRPEGALWLAAGALCGSQIRAGARRSSPHRATSRAGAAASSPRRPRRRAPSSS